MRKRKSAANRNKRQTQTNSSPSTPEQPVPLERHLDPTKESAEDDIEEIPLEILESHASIVERLSGEVAGEQFASAVLSPHPFLWLVSQLKALLYSIQRTFQTSHTGLLDDLGRWFVMALGLSIFGLGQPTEAAPTKALVNDGRKVKRRRRRVDEGAEGPQHFPGMVNLSGVLCYMNSVLQSLASVTSLVTHLEKIIDLAIESDVQTPVSDALTEVISELNTPQSRQPPPLRPHNLLAALHTLPQIRRLLSTREQQDAHELFVVLAEAISNESLKVVAEIARIRGMADVLSLQAYCFDKGSVRSYTPSVSSVGTEGRDIGKERRTKIRGLAQPWEGLVARRRVCKKCGYCGEVRMDTLGGLELPTPMAGHATLNACFADFFAPELLSGVTCEMCSLRETISYYEDEISRLSLPPNQSHLAASSKRTKPESTFDALENLPSENASGEISDKRRKRCNEAKKVLIRLHEMLASRSVSFFGESIPVDPKSNDAGGEGIKVKWQKVNNDSVRQSIITRPPVTMRLGISRTGVTPYGDVIKKSTRVQIPQILDASEFVSNGVWEEPQAERTMAIKTKRVLYRLDSVICHYGYTTNSGHFISIRRKPTKLSTPTDDGPRWGPEKARMSCPPGCRCSDCVYFGPARGIVQNTPGQGFLRISDDEVEEVGAEALVDAEPAVFMLFYEKIEECAEKSGAVEGRSRERSELQSEASRKSVSVNSTS